jgi:hypothetical protein
MASDGFMTLWCYILQDRAFCLFLFFFTRINTDWFIEGNLLEE